MLWTSSSFGGHLFFEPHPLAWLWLGHARLPGMELSRDGHHVLRPKLLYEGRSEGFGGWVVLAGDEGIGCLLEFLRVFENLVLERLLGEPGAFLTGRRHLLRSWGWLLLLCRRERLGGRGLGRRFRHRDLLSLGVRALLEISEQVSDLLEWHSQEAAAEGGGLVGGLGFFPRLRSVQDVQKGLVQLHLDELIGARNPRCFLGIRRQVAHGRCTWNSRRTRRGSGLGQDVAELLGKRVDLFLRSAQGIAEALPHEVGVHAGIGPLRDFHPELVGTGRSCHPHRGWRRRQSDARNPIGECLLGVVEVSDVSLHPLAYGVECSDELIAHPGVQGLNPARERDLWAPHPDGFVTGLVDHRTKELAVAQLVGHPAKLVDLSVQLLDQCRS